MAETDLNQTTNQQMSRTAPGAADGFTAEERALRRKRADTLCVISLILFAGVPLVMIFLPTAIDESGLLSTENVNIITTVCLIILCVSMLISLVLMMVTKIKYKESRFARILFRVCGWITVGIVAVITCMFLFVLMLRVHL